MPEGLVVLQEAPARVSAPPPRWYREAGDVRRAWPCEGPFGRASLRGSPAQRAGVRYQRKAEKYLWNQMPGIQLGPWFAFHNAGGKVRYCQPDALWVREGNLLCLEIKIRFTSDAFWQLDGLYVPVLKVALGREPHCGIICKSFDPAMVVPRGFVLLDKCTPEAFAAASPRVGVFQWRP